MKTSMFSTMVVLFLLLLAPSAKAQLGVAAGLNYEDLSDIETSSFQATFDAASGYHFGVFFDTDLGPVGVRLGAFYRDLGEFSVSDIRDVAVTMLEFPVDIRIGVIPIPLLNPYVFAGPVFSIPESSDDEFNEALEDFNVAGNIGAGFAIRMGGTTLMPEFRYSVGVSRFTKDEFTLLGQTITSDSAQRLNTVQLRLGLRF